MYCTYPEKPLGNRRRGFCEATLRIRENTENITEILTKAFAKLFDIYNDVPGEFATAVTANVILKKGQDQPTYSVFYGHYGQTHLSRAGLLGEKKRYVFDEVESVFDLGDVENINTSFSVSDFRQVFQLNHSDTSVTVDSIISIVYVIHRFLDDFERDKQTDGQVVEKLQFLK